MIKFVKVNFSTFVKKQKEQRQKYFKTPIVEGQYKVTPALNVPNHIIRPDYVSIFFINKQDNKNPVFGQYQGQPVVHNQDMINRLKKAAKVASSTLMKAAESVKVGMTTEDIDKIVHDSIIEQGAYPSPIGFMGFPKSVCTSVNEVCCHGIPDGRVLEDGDSLNIDVTCFIDGVHGDNSMMATAGNAHPDVLKLNKYTQMALYEAIKICKPGQQFKMIGDICEQVAEDGGFYVCQLFTGHGIGNLMHMPPQVVHHQNDSKDIMVPGNVFTIEPILMMFPGKYFMWRDNFTVLSPNNPSGSLYIIKIQSLAQYEHTILITETGYEVITLREGEIIK